MAIKQFILTGDCHGRVDERLGNIQRNMNIENPSDIAVIILGDAGLNFYLNGTDIRKKKIISNHGFRIYCVRGNHEERPENLKYELAWDDDVTGEVYYDPINPEIRYFQDGEVYNIEGHRTLVIGGAYSVDKYYRLKRAKLGELYNVPQKSGWFADEQLSDLEMQAIAYHHYGQEFDLILTHTCPICWEPSDLFLGFVDQSTVDKSMELFLDEVCHETKWKVWCFGHYHADRLERPGVEQFYYRYEWLNNVWEHWNNENNEYELSLLNKSPNFNMEW